MKPCIRELDGLQFEAVIVGERGTVVDVIYLDDWQHELNVDRSEVELVERHYGPDVKEKIAKVLSKMVFSRGSSAVQPVVEHQDSDGTTTLSDGAIIFEHWKVKPAECTPETEPAVATGISTPPKRPGSTASTDAPGTPNQVEVVACGGGLRGIRALRGKQ